MWPVLTFLLDVLSWIVDAIGFGYTFAVLIIWCIQRFGLGPTDRMHRATITTNTLLLVVGIISCIDMPVTLGLELIMYPEQLHFIHSSSGYWFSNYSIVFWTTRFMVIGLLPLLFLGNVRRASINWSLFVAAVLFIWGNSMDFLRHGYLCYCDARPLKTYALLLLIFAGVFTATYLLLRKKARPTAPEL